MKNEIIITSAIINISLALMLFIIPMSKKNPEVQEVIVREKGLYIELDNGNEFFIDTEKLENAGLISTSNIVDWNVVDDEMAIITANDYEYYAYKKRNVY